MSLEQALADNTAAIRELIAAMKAKPAAQDEAATETAPNEPQAPATDTTPKSGKASSEPEKEKPAESPSVTYDEVRKLITDIARQSKDKAVATLQRFGVQNGKQLKEDQYAEFIAYAVKVAAGEVDPEASDA